MMLELSSEEIYKL